jgi:hypothetical protein
MYNDAADPRELRLNINRKYYLINFLICFYDKPRLYMPEGTLREAWEMRRVQAVPRLEGKAAVLRKGENVIDRVYKKDHRGKAP